MIVARHQTSPMRLAITKQIVAEVYDVILVEFSFMCQYLMQPGLLLDDPDRPLIAVDHHVVGPKVYQYLYDVERDPLVRLFRRFEIPRLKKYLHQVLMFGDKHLFLGQEDLDYIRTQISDANWAKKLVYRPTGLLLERYPLSDPAQAEPYTIGFFGSFDWEANIDAVFYFVEEILPLIRQQLPQVRFVVAGRAAPNRIRNLGSQGSIEFVGEVDNMFSVVQRLTMIAVPLRVGAGTRLKILEAMAWGKPIVATSVGVEGIEYIAGEEIILADTADSFAEATAALLNDPASQYRLARAGRCRIEMHYTAQCSVDQLQKALAIPLTEN
jgi:glycosyltransferase involved in cell wall biosynthesis